MKYKALLAGNNNTVIDDFFFQMYGAFESVTSSIRYDDVVRHMKYFTPDFFVYCLKNEPRENFPQMIRVAAKLREKNVAFILIGAKEECVQFERITLCNTDLKLYTPLAPEDVKTKITTFITEWKKPEKRISVSAAEESVPSPRPEESLSLEELFARTGSGESEDEDAFMERVEAFERQLAMQREGDEEERLLPQSPATAEPEPPRRRHILVVDDDPMMLKMLKEQLHETYDVATAVSGKIAMKFLERRKTDMILLDYNMPVESGPEILEKIRANESTKDIPVIFLTGVSEREKIREALAMKPQGYLLKPVDRQKLLEIIEKTIGSR